MYKLIAFLNQEYRSNLNFADALYGPFYLNALSALIQMIDNSDYDLAVCHALKENLAIFIKAQLSKQTYDLLCQLSYNHNDRGVWRDQEALVTKFINPYLTNQ